MYGQLDRIEVMLMVILTIAINLLTK